MSDQSVDQTGLTARQRQGLESRARILDAAERSVAERGFSATSISLVCQSSGLSASSIYWHFNSKEELLAAVVERGASRWHRSQPAWDQFDGDVTAFFEAVAKGVDGKPEFLRLLMMLMLEGHQGTPSAARDLVHQVWHRTRKGLARAMADAFALPGDTASGTAAEADRLARFALACIDGAFVDAHIDPDGTSIDQLFTDLLAALRALAARKDDRP